MAESLLCLHPSVFHVVTLISAASIIVVVTRHASTQQGVTREHTLERTGCV